MKLFNTIDMNILCHCARSVQGIYSPPCGKPQECPSQYGLDLVEIKRRKRTVYRWHRSAQWRWCDSRWVHVVPSSRRIRERQSLRSSSLWAYSFHLKSEVISIRLSIHAVGCFSSVLSPTTLSPRLPSHVFLFLLLPSALPKGGGCYFRRVLSLRSNTKDSVRRKIWKKSACA